MNKKTVLEQSSFTKAPLKKTSKYSKDYLSKVYRLILGFLTKDGKKNRAFNLIENSFLIATKTLGTSKLNILDVLTQKLSLCVEIRKVKVHGKTHLVPFPIKDSRKIYNIAKILIGSSKSRSKKGLKLHYTIAMEIVDIFNDNSCGSLTTARNIMNLAIKNRANATFRWY